jgi:hypothetical protein
MYQKVYEKKEILLVNMLCLIKKWKYIKKNVLNYKIWKGFKFMIRIINFKFII